MSSMYRQLFSDVTKYNISKIQMLLINNTYTTCVCLHQLFSYYLDVSINDFSSQQNSAAARLSKWLKIACHAHFVSSAANTTLLHDIPSG